MLSQVKTSVDSSKFEVTEILCKTLCKKDTGIQSNIAVILSF